jgi:protein-disulfide isomerase
LEKQSGGKGKSPTPRKGPGYLPYIALVALVILLAGLGGLVAVVANQAMPTSTPTAVKAPTAVVPNTPVPVARCTAAPRVEHVRGNANAKVTIIEYSDFQCPFCGQFAVQTFPQIDEKYIKTGLVKYVFRPLVLPNHLQAQKAMEAAESAGAQGKFWEMHDLLFGRQSQWAEKGGAVEIFKGYAKSLGLDETAFAQALDCGRYAGIGNENAADAQKAGISGTPTFFVNGRILGGAYPFDQFAKVIEEELAK